MEAKTLESAGLTKNESIVYLTLLKIGTSKTGEILKNSNLNSGKIYEILNSLMEKGLVAQTIIDNVKHFSAADPSEIISYVEKRKQLLEEKEKQIKSILPQLNLLKQTEIDPTEVFVYTGFKGFKTVLNEIFKEEKNSKEHFAMGLTQNKPKKYNDYWLKVNKNLNPKKIKRRLIFSDRNQYAKEHIKLGKIEVRVLPNITPAAINITGDSIAILNYENNGTFVLIKNKAISKSFKNFFEQLWKIAKP